MQLNTTPKIEPYQAVILTALVYFAVRLVFLAFNLSPYVPPDETTQDTRVDCCATGSSLSGSARSSCKAIQMDMHAPADPPWRAIR